MHLFFTSKIHAPDAANTSALMGLGNHNCPYAIPNFATLPLSACDVGKILLYF